MEEKDVWLAQRGDKAAFTRLIKEMQGSLYRVAKGILKDDADCADALQEGITKGYLRLNQLQDPKLFKTWMTRIVMNQCYDMIKKGKKIVLMESVEDKRNVVDQKKDYYELEEALDQLQEDHRIVITLFYYEDYSISEISEMLEVKEGTVKSRLNRARKRLAELMNLMQERSGDHGRKEAGRDAEEGI